MKKGQNAQKISIFEVRMQYKIFYASYKGVGNKVSWRESLLEQFIMSNWVLLACYLLLKFSYFSSFFDKKMKKLMFLGRRM